MFIIFMVCDSSLDFNEHSNYYTIKQSRVILLASKWSLRHCISLKFVMLLFLDSILKNWAAFKFTQNELNSLGLLSFHSPFPFRSTVETQDFFRPSCLFPPFTSRHVYFPFIFPFYSCCSNVQMLGTAFIHEFHIVTAAKTLTFSIMLQFKRNHKYQSQLLTSG